MVSAFALAPTAFAQSSSERCETATELLENRETLAPGAAEYFETVQEEECSQEQSPSRENAPPDAMNSDTSATRSAVSSSGPYTYAQCADARAEMARMTTAEQRNSDRAKRLVAIYTSRDCEQIMARRAQSSSADPGMASMMQMLREEGIDIDARFAQAREDCRRRFAFSNSDGAAAQRNQAIADCTAQAQQVAYTSAINEMNGNRQSTYRREMERHRAEVAELERQRAENERKVAAEKEAYERSMAEWRRAVRLCNEGKREYCAQED